MRFEKVLVRTFARSVFLCVARGFCILGACTGTLAMPVEENYANGTRPTEENYANGTRPVAPVSPEGEIYAGKLDSAFSSRQQVVGALHASNGDVVGIVHVKAGKANRGFATFSAKVLLAAGKSSSARTKVRVSDYGYGIQSIQGELTFKGSVGTMYLDLRSDGSFRLLNSAYFMRSAVVGGNLGGTTAMFSLSGDVDGIVQGDVVGEYLPYSLAFDVSGGKWHFAKAGTLKLVTNNDMGARELSASGENVSRLKLSYTARSGVFRGSFVVYSLETAAGKTRLKKTRVLVTGFVVDGVGHGQAAVKTSSGAALAVTVR